MKERKFSEVVITHGRGIGALAASSIIDFLTGGGALTSLEREGPKDVHYSSVVSLGRDDALKIKAMIVDHIEAVQAKIEPSPEETIFSFCLDFYEL